MYFYSDELSISASNEYGSFSAPYPWLYEVSGSQLVEPYRATTLALSGKLLLSSQICISIL